VDPRDLGGDGSEARYPPIAAGDYILGRINDSMGYRKKRAQSAAMNAAPQPVSMNNAR